MTAKYTKLPTDDPSADQPDSVPVFDFTSIHNYNYPKYFSYSNSGKAANKRFKSIFTYTGDSAMKDPEILGNVTRSTVRYRQSYKLYW